MPRTKAVPTSELTKRLNIRLTPAEQKQVRREALERDISAQDFAREAILRMLRRSPCPDPEAAAAS